MITYRVRLRILPRDVVEHPPKVSRRVWTFLHELERTTPIYSNPGVDVPLVGQSVIALDVEAETVSAALIFVETVAAAVLPGEVIDASVKPARRVGVHPYDRVRTTDEGGTE